MVIILRDLCFFSKKFDQTKEFCILREIPESIKIRIKQFYIDNKGEYNKGKINLNQ